ncbi:MAG: hypothetical protein AAF596_06225, partial [Planctomycetota bacterium]
ESPEFLLHSGDSRRRLACGWMVCLKTMLARLRRRLVVTLRRRPLLPFLLAATLAVDCVLLAVADLGVGAFHISFAFAQLGLLGLWAGQLRRRWKARSLGAIVAAVVASSSFASFEGVNEMFTIYLGFFAAVCFMTVATQYVARVRTTRDGHSTPDGRGEAPPLRFSIAGVLTATTIVAVLASLLRFIDVPLFPLWTAAVCLPLAVLPVITLRLLRRWRYSSVSAGAVMAVSFACGLCFVLLSGGPGGGSTPWLMATFMQGGVYLVWLFALRVRLHRLATVERAAPRLRVVAADDRSPVETDDGRHAPEPAKPVHPIDLEA